MKYLKLLLPFLFIGYSSRLSAQETMGIDQQIDQWFGYFTGWFVDLIFYKIPFGNGVEIYWVLFPLLLGSIYFTFYFKFANICHIPTSLNIVSGKYDHLEDYNTDGTKREAKLDKSGEVSHFQALTAALSATVGLGNIAGVAIAISTGGAGATFWMILAGFLGMSSKFVECTLGVKYREIGKDSTVYGGPMYYLSKGLKELKKEQLGKVLAVLFAILCIGASFGGGNMFQVNQAVQLLEYMTGGEHSPIFGYRWVVGVIMAVLVGIVIIGGIKSIANVTDKIVPFMVGTYVLAAIFILCVKFDQIPWAFGQIFAGAFTGKGIAGGILGVMIQGFKRACFSNEAGTGSSAIAHSAVITNHPSSEGLVALLEPFIDTVVVCTMTALVLIITGNVDAANATLGTSGAVLLTTSAFGSVISWFPYLLTVAVTLFAFSTMISWSYYGYQSWAYLFGKDRKTEFIYKGIFCIFTILGSATALNKVIDFSDAMIFGMLVPNMIGLILLAPKVKEELSGYIKLTKTKK